MRRQDKAIKEIENIEQILKSGHLCQLAFAAEPAPYIVTLNYGYADGTLYFHGASQGRKIDLIRELGRAAFTVAIDRGLIKGGPGCDWTTHYASVVGHGSIELLDSAEEKIRGLDILMAQYSSARHSFPASSVAATAVFKLKIDEITAKVSPAEKG